MKKKSKKIIKQELISFAVDHLSEIISEEKINWAQEEVKKVKAIIKKMENLIEEIKE